ncbi:lipopolysaccharide biosynthesis protein [Muricoccus radiodurans]|uniref:lipopolysaccharide biosynthesis protein n=1 Tax=Muricoccus radiodurans TaxID=2231721 RepID=UPI003CE82BA0
MSLSRSESLSALRSRLLSPTAVGAAAGLLDQVLVSLANLAVGLLVLRYGTKAEFGLYGLAYTAIVVATSFSSSLFGMPMTVSYYKVAAEERAAYAGALFEGQAVLSLLLCGVVFALALAGGEVALGGSPEQQAWALALLCCPLAMAQGLVRTHRFLVQQGLVALGLSALHAAAWAGLTGLFIMQGAAAHLAALGGYGLACGVVALLGLIRSGLVAVGPARVVQAVRSVWEQGRWAMGGVAVGSLQNSAHLYLLAWLTSVEAVAEVNAGRMLISPIGMVLIGMNRGMLPMMAKLFAEGRQGALRRLAAGALLFLLLLTVVYLAALFVSWDLLLALVLRGKYEHVGALVLAWAAVVTVQAVNLILSAQVQVEGDFRSLTLLSLYTAIPMLIVAVPAIWWGGGMGGLLALVAGQAALTALLVRLLRRGGKRPDMPGPASA